MRLPLKMRFIFAVLLISVYSRFASFRTTVLMNLMHFIWTYSLKLSGAKGRLDALALRLAATRSQRLRPSSNPFTISAMDLRISSSSSQTLRTKLTENFETFGPRYWSTILWWGFTELALLAETQARQLTKFTAAITKQSLKRMARASKYEAFDSEQSDPPRL